MRVGDGLGAEGGVFGVFWFGGGVRRRGAVGEGRGDGVGGFDGCVARGEGVDGLLVGRPEDCPVHGDGVAARALAEHELAQGGDGEPAPEDPPDGRHARVVPAGDDAGVDDLGELALGEEGADEVDARKVPELDGAEVEGGEEPLVLGVAVGVLGGAERVGHALDAVDYGAGKVVRGVDVPGPAGTVVGYRDGVFALLGRDGLGEAVDDGVPHRAVGGIEGDPRTDAVLPTEVGSLLHLLEDGQALVGWPVSALAGEPVDPVLFLDVGVCVVGVGVPVLDHALADLVQLLEVIAGVRYTVWDDAQELQVLEDGVLKFLLLLGRVRVIKPGNELAIECLVSKIVVEEGSFSMPDVQISPGFGQPFVISGFLGWISRGLRGKPSHHTVLGVLEANVVIAPRLAGGRTLLLLLGLRCLNFTLDFGMTGLDE